MPPVVPPGYAKGVDLSHFNGDVTNVIRASVYAISQATVGLWVDPAYAGDARETLALHKIHGAYHYGVYGPGPTRQASKFLAVVGDKPQFLAVDAESRGSNRLLNHPETIAALIVNIRRLDPHKRKILLYSSRATSVLLRGKQVSIWSAITVQDGNWVADYVGNPSRPNVSPHPNWNFWQYSGTGVDKDVFHGSEGDLRAWLR